MEKFSYNNFEGMDIEEPFYYKIGNKINILNELEYFQLFFDDEIMNFFLNKNQINTLQIY